jgi:type VI secretion system secreted protein Hcp
MAVDMFLKLDGIDGESKDSKHKSHVEVSSFSWGVSQTNQDGGAGTGKVVVHDFSFSHKVDKASPLLMLHCATGKHIPTATLRVVKGGDKPVVYMQYKLTDVLVSSFQHGGHQQGNVPTDQFSLNFSKVEFSYRFQKGDLTLDPPIEVEVTNFDRGDPTT